MTMNMIYVVAHFILANAFTDGFHKMAMQTNTMIDVKYLEMLSMWHLEYHIVDLKTSLKYQNTCIHYLIILRAKMMTFSICYASSQTSILKDIG